MCEGHERIVNMFRGKIAHLQEQREDWENSAVLLTFRYSDTRNIYSHRSPAGGNPTASSL